MYIEDLLSNRTCYCHGLMHLASGSCAVRGMEAELAAMSGPRQFVSLPWGRAIVQAGAFCTPARHYIHAPWTNRVTKWLLVSSLGLKIQITGLLGMASAIDGLS